MTGSYDYSAMWIIVRHWIFNKPTAGTQGLTRHSGSPQHFSKTASLYLPSQSLTFSASNSKPFTRSWFCQKKRREKICVSTSKAYTWRFPFLRILLMIESCTNEISVCFMTPRLMFGLPVLHFYGKANIHSTNFIQASCQAKVVVTTTWEPFPEKSLTYWSIGWNKESNLGLQISPAMMYISIYHETYVTFLR